MAAEQLAALGDLTRDAEVVVVHAARERGQNRGQVRKQALVVVAAASAHAAAGRNQCGRSRGGRGGKGNRQRRAAGVSQRRGQQRGAAQSAAGRPIRQIGQQHGHQFAQHGTHQAPRTVNAAANGAAGTTAAADLHGRAGPTCTAFLLIVAVRLPLPLRLRLRDVEKRAQALELGGGLRDNRIDRIGDARQQQHQQARAVRGQHAAQPLEQCG